MKPCDSQKKRKETGRSEKMLCTSKSGCCHGTAGHCNMMCRSVKSRQKFRQACNGIARDLSREESSSSEIKRVETANEKRRKGESESAGVSGDERRRRGWNVKSKQSDAQREIELGERVSLFFINRPIKQERPPSMFYFVWLLRPFPPHVPFASLFLFFLLPAFLSFVLFFIAVANPSARVSVSASVRLAPFLGANLLFLLHREETHPLSAEPAAEREEFSFCYFIQLFREREDSFYYLGAQLQCLADNKPMKATFEPEGPLKSPFSPTSRFFSSRTLTLVFSLLLVLVCSRVPILFPSIADPVPFLHSSSCSVRHENFAPFFCFRSLLCVLICLPDSAGSSRTSESIRIQNRKICFTFRKQTYHG